MEPEYADYMWNPERLASGYDAAHLGRFRLSLGRVPELDKVGGKNARSFAVPFPGAAPQNLPDRQIARSEVMGLCEKTPEQIETLCAAIFAWGGMRVENRDRLIGDLSWLQVANGIRAGALSRRAAFDDFRSLRRQKRLSGLGPAFYTKLIYFLSPRDSTPPYAYIMDQWASRTVNLLTGRNVVLLDVATTTRWEANGAMGKPVTTCSVSDCNTADHYENFCAQMDTLALVCGQGPDQIDRASMGEGDKSWRDYLEAHRAGPCR